MTLVPKLISYYFCGPFMVTLNFGSYCLIFHFHEICLCLQSKIFRKSIEDMAARSLRCVAIAYRPHELEDVPTDGQLSEWALPDDDLVLLAIVGIKVVRS